MAFMALVTLGEDFPEFGCPLPRSFLTGSLEALRDADTLMSCLAGLVGLQGVLVGVYGRSFAFFRLDLLEVPRGFRTTESFDGGFSVRTLRLVAFGRRIQLEATAFMTHMPLVTILFLRLALSLGDTDARRIIDIHAGRRRCLCAALFR